MWLTAHGLRYAFMKFEKFMTATKKTFTGVQAAASACVCCVIWSVCMCMCACVRVCVCICVSMHALLHVLCLCNAVSSCYVCVLVCAAALLILALLCREQVATQSGSARGRVEGRPAVPQTASPMRLALSGCISVKDSQQRTDCLCVSSSGS